MHQPVHRGKFLPTKKRPMFIGLPVQCQGSVLDKAQQDPPPSPQKCANVPALFRTRLLGWGGGGIIKGVGLVNTLWLGHWWWSE